MTEKFKVGDKVKGLGMTGVVIKSSSIDQLTGVPVRVRFDNYLEYSFLPDGRFFEAGEPCLELLERPKQKVKRTYYKAYYAINKNKIPIYESVYYDSKSDIYSDLSNKILIEIEEKEFEIEE